MKNVFLFTLLLVSAYCSAQNNIPYGNDVIRPEHTLQIAMNIPRSYCWILPNSGHSTPIVYSELFNTTIDDFFTKPYREIKGEGRFN